MENNIKKVIIKIIIFVLSIMVAFFLGYNFSIKNHNYFHLDEKLKNAEELIKKIEERNDELFILTENQEKIIKELKIENENQKNDLNAIKEITFSTENKIMEIDESMDRVSDKMNKIKENQKIFKEYIINISNIVKENDDE